MNESFSHTHTRDLEGDSLRASGPTTLSGSPRSWEAHKKISHLYSWISTVQLDPPGWIYWSCCVETSAVQPCGHSGQFPQRGVNVREVRLRWCISERNLVFEQNDSQRKHYCLLFFQTKRQKTSVICFFRALHECSRVQLQCPNVQKWSVQRWLWSFWVYHTTPS